MDPEQKPGWQTTEFWLTLVAQALSLLVLLGLIPAGERATLEGAITAAVQSAAALIVSAATIWKYIQTRGEVKQAALEVRGVIVSASMARAVDKAQGV